MTKPIYGNDHRKTRKALEPYVALGHSNCSLCGKPITIEQAAANEWDLDHYPGTTQYRGPAHSSCNRGDGGRRNKQRPPPPPRTY